MKSKNTKKNRTNTLIIIVAIIFILSLGAAMILLIKNDDKKDNSQNETSSTINSSKETPKSTSSVKESDQTTNKTTTKKTTDKKTDKKTTKKQTNNENQSTDNCNYEELERIAEANKPNKYAVWKTKPTFDVPSNIEYGIRQQKFFWMWYQVGTIEEGGVTKPDYIWVVASDKESGMGYPSGEGNSIHEIKPSGHFKNAMKYLIPKPTDQGTKEGERRGVVSLYYFDGTIAVRCD